MIEGIILSRSGSFRTDGESWIEDGILCLENDKTRIISATDFASIDSLKTAGTTSDGKSRLAVYCDYDDISEAIRFIRDNGSSIREYRMFGEHNTDLLSPVIQSLITGGEISMVKSIQRGIIPRGDASGYTDDLLIYGNTSYTRTYYVDVTVNSVNVEKVDIDIQYMTDTFPAFSEMIDSTTLRIYVGHSGSAQTWQTHPGIEYEIVEYY